MVCDSLHFFAERLDRNVGAGLANLVAEALVLSQIDVKSLFEVLEILRADLRDVFLNVGERIRHIFITPGACVKQHLKDCLFLYKHLICFVGYSTWDLGCLSEINTIRRGLPVILDWSEVRSANVGQTAV